MKARHLIPALGLMISTPAFAWKHLGFVWTADQIPVVFHVADNANNEDGNCQDDVPVGYCTEGAVWAAEQWTNVPCTDMAVEIGADPIPNAFTNGNGDNEIVFEDPAEEIERAGDPGTLAWSQSRGNVTQVEVNGQLYEMYNDADITFGKDRNFQSMFFFEDGQGTCFDANIFESTMVHEMGHSLGLGHSCEEEDICVDPALRSATMFWISGGACDDSKAELGTDDTNALQALYGPIATFSCAGENDAGTILGIVPFDMSCVVNSNRLSDVTNVEWVWGDSETSEGVTGRHTYNAPGNYTIQVAVDGESDGCDPETGASGPWSYDYRRVGYVTACDVVEGEFEAEYDETSDGLTYKMRNNSDVSVYGCISEIEWNVFEGGSAEGDPIQTVAAWEPNITFPERGEYTIVMNLGGPAGTSGATLTIDAGAGTGCNTGATSASATLGALGLLGLFGLRRR